MPQSTLETDSFVEEGKSLFEENCATCHESNERGNIKEEKRFFMYYGGPGVKRIQLCVLLVNQERLKETRYRK